MMVLGQWSNLLAYFCLPVLLLVSQYARVPLISYSSSSVFGRHDCLIPSYVGFCRRLASIVKTTLFSFYAFALAHQRAGVRNRQYT